MKIRRVQYNIDFIHILTFREEYKDAVLPYFKFDGLKYGIDNENTIHESIRLLFTVENFAISIRKEGITFIYEGDPTVLKRQNNVTTFFFDIYEKIKLFRGFIKTTKNSIILHSVDILDKGKYDLILTENKFFSQNPFGALNDFTCVYEFKRDNSKILYHFGNYTPSDITKHDLMPFKTEYNKDLIDGYGLMSRIEIQDDCNLCSFSKFKTFLNKTEEIVSSFNIE